jgi:hypothetical protein
VRAAEHTLKDENPPIPSEVEAPKRLAQGSTGVRVIASSQPPTIEELETLRRRSRRLVIGLGIATLIVLGSTFYLGRRRPAATGTVDHIEMAQHPAGH